MTLEEVLNKFATDPTSLTADERRIMSDSFKQLMAGQVPSSRGISAEDLIQRLNQTLIASTKTPEGAAALRAIIQERQGERFYRRNKPFFDAILGGADLATSLSQISKSNKEIAKLTRPSSPAASILDPAINAAIADAQRGSLDAMRSLDPAKAEIAQQRLMDENAARSVSGGQAGAYQGGVTAASLRASRASDRLPVIADQIRRGQQARLDQLLGMRQNVLGQEFNNRMAITDRDREQYNIDLATAAQLGQTGRINLRNTLGSLPTTLSQVGSRFMPTLNPYESYGNEVRQSLAQNLAKSLGPAPLLSMPGISPDLSQYKQRYIRRNVHNLAAGATLLNPNLDSAGTLGIPMIDPFSFTRNRY